VRVSANWICFNFFVVAESVLITGSSGGIGSALAEEFARAGWKVFATARNAQQPELSELTRKWENLAILTLDVTQESTIWEAAKRLADGSLDVLINNAAIFPGDGQEPFETIDPEWFNQAFDTNVVGVARVTKAFLPHLRRSAHARIANISSGAGSISEKEDANYYPYSVSKAALNMLTRALAAEFREEEIIVTAISPGWVKTRMGGPNAPLSPRQSAESLFRTITGLTMAQSGKFFGRDGEPYAW
jgi:NAD(P)-dependent dehydrogenase (short-subunit alcohol dehydrogenase family)